MARPTRSQLLPHQKRTSLLVVDDNEETATFLKKSINGATDFYEVNTVSSGREALDILFSTAGPSYKIVILDWLLQDVAGNVFVQKLRSDARFDFLDFVICSSAISEDQVFLFNELNIKHWVSSTGGSSQILEKLDKIRVEQQRRPELASKIRELKMAVENSDIKKALKIEALPEVRAELGKNPRYAFLQAELFIQRHEVDKAISFLQQAIRSFTNVPKGDSVRALATLGKALCIGGKYQEALIVFERLVEKSPKNHSHRIMLGDALVGLNKRDEAREQYQTVLHEDEKNKHALVGIAKVEVTEGHFEAAKTFFDKAEGNFENYMLASFFNNYAVTLSKQEKPKEAALIYENALQYLDKFKPLIYFNQGLAYQRMGDKSSAEKCFEEVIKLGDSVLIAKKNTLRQLQEKKQEESSRSGSEEEFLKKSS